MAMKRPMSDEHAYTYVEEAHPALKRLRISDSSADLQAHGPALPPLEHGVELTSGLVAQLSSGKELPQYHAMNALLKQLHMERLQRLVAHEAAAAHARRASDPH